MSHSKPGRPVLTTWPVQFDLFYNIFASRDYELQELGIGQAG